MAPSKTLNAVYILLDIALLAAGAICIAMSIVWRTPDVLRDLVINNIDLIAGLVMGVTFILTSIFGLIGIFQRNHITMPLVALNWMLFVDALYVMVIATAVWFYSLRQRNEFYVVWKEQTSAVRTLLQDQLQCCGYFDSTDNVISAGFCQDPAFAATQQPCVTPITAFSDYTLNNIFTSTYGFMAIILTLFLASLCVINKRKEEERFRKIDAKRGGGGFV